MIEPKIQSEEILMEEKLRENEDQYHNLYMSSGDAIMTMEPPEWKFTSGNPATIKMFGAKDEQQFISLGPWNLSPEFQPDGQKSGEKAKKMIEKAFNEGSNFFEWIHRRVNGEDFPATVLLSKTKIKGKEILQATVRDISGQKETEKKLEEKIKELERTNEIMVGRELKMIELKKELGELKRRLETNKQK